MSSLLPGHRAPWCGFRLCSFHLINMSDAGIRNVARNARFTFVVLEGRAESGSIRPEIDPNCIHDCHQEGFYRLTDRYLNSTAEKNRFYSPFISDDAKFSRENAWALADNPNRRKVLIRSDSSKPEETYPHQISRWSERHQHDWVFNSAIWVEAITEPARVSKIPYESHHAASASNICALEKTKSWLLTLA